MLVTYEVGMYDLPTLLHLFNEDMLYVLPALYYLF